MDDHGNDLNMYLRNKPRDLWWRKSGLWLYFFISAVALLLAPSGLAEWRGLDYPLRLVPAIDSLIQSSSAPGKIVAWVFVWFVSYPAFHLSFRSRVYAKQIDFTRILIAAVVISVVDIFLLAMLGLEVGALQGRGIGKAWLNLMRSDGIGFPLAAFIISLVYSLAFFMSLHIFSLLLRLMKKDS